MAYRQLLALVFVMGGASHASAQSVSGAGDVDPAAPSSPGQPNWTIATQLGVGVSGVGTLTIDGGGILNSNATGPDGFGAIIGTNNGAHGTVTVQGAGSSWNNPAGLVVGYTGYGELDINAGGKVTAGDTTVDIDDTGEGHLNVDGAGSSFESTGEIYLGTYGSGHLQISAGGRVSSVYGAVGGGHGGNGPIGDGQALVTGLGSTWTNSAVLTIGSFGAGDLRIEAGGAVTSSQGYIGASDDGFGNRSVGTVTVTGPGSSWIVAPFNLSIGYGGTGSLTIEDGGLVRAAGGIAIGSNAGGIGTLTVQSAGGDPGVLETGGITGGAGTASVRLDGGLLRATADNPAFFGNFGTRDVTLGPNGGIVDTDSHDIGISPRLVGAGGLAKTGAGTLVLTGANTYAGATQVNAGRLEINGDQTAATGLTTVAASATLAGAGIVGGNVNVVGGAIAPGTTDASGTLTINGDLSLVAASSLNYRLGEAGVVGGALNDLLVVHGALMLGGVLNVTQSDGGTFGLGIYRLINYDGALTDNGLALGTLPAGGSNIIQTSIANQVNLVNTATPLAPVNFWDGPKGIAADGAITGNDGVWQAGGPITWTQADGAANGAFVNGVFAIFAAARGTVTVDDSAGGPVSVSGMQFASDGYKITGGAVGLDAGDAIVRVGDGTAQDAAFKATIASELTGAGQLDKTDLGTLILTGANSYTGGTKVSSGTLQLGDGGTSGSIRGDVAVDGVLAFDRSDAATFAGAISGAGVLQQIGSGTMALTADSSAFTGRTQVQAGTLEVDGVLGGSTEVFSGGRLTGVGQVGPTANRGVIAPGRGGFGTLIIAGDYAGLGGSLEIKTQLGDDASPTDRLVVTGATSGVTPVKVVNLGGTGAQTVQGIRVVQVGGSSAGRFVLANGDYVIAGRSALVAGAYGYTLQQGQRTGSQAGDWYLRSTLTDPAISDGGAGGPETEPATPPGGPASPPQVPLYQPGAPVYEAYAATLLSLSSLPTLRQRVGDRRWDANDADREGVWGRIEARTDHLEPWVSTSGVHLTTDSWRAQFGIDRVLVAQGGSRLVGALTGQFGAASTKLSSVYGGGDIGAKSYGLGATLTWYGAGGAYLDGQAQGVWFNSDLTSSLVGRETDGNDGHGYGLSLEAGQAVQLSPSVSLTPQAQLGYASTGFGGFDDRFDAHVASHKGDSLQGRLGLALDHRRSWSDAMGRSRTVSLYGLVNLQQEFLGGTRVLVSGTPIDSRQDRTWGGLGVGGGYTWGDGRYALHGEASADTGLKHLGDSYAIGGTVGLRIRF